MTAEKKIYLKEILEAKLSDLILQKINDFQLDKRLEQQHKEKFIKPEQWFREPTNWYELSSYTNPYRSVTDEIGILFRHEEELSQMINKTLKVFWGVGIADSEIFPAIWELKTNSYIEINAIDVVRYFLEGFILCLKNLRRDYPDGQIMFVGSNALFEEFEKESIKPVNSIYRTATHICFGNTIGNFDQDEIFEIFRRNSDKGDYLLIGYHLLKNPQKILSLYEHNPRFESFITEPINRTRRFGTFSRIWRRLRGVEVEWRYNKESGYIEARLGEFSLFRSKKYIPEKLQEYAKKFGFTHIVTHTQGDSAISLFKAT